MFYYGFVVCLVVFVVLIIFGCCFDCGDVIYVCWCLFSVGFILLCMFYVRSLLVLRFYGCCLCAYLIWLRLVGCLPVCLFYVDIGWVCSWFMFVVWLWWLWLTLVSCLRFGLRLLLLLPFVFGYCCVVMFVFCLFRLFSWLNDV